MGRHSKEFKQSVLAKMLPPNAQSVAKIHAETGIAMQTLYNWRSKAINNGQPLINGDITADAWSNEAKFAVLLETASLNEHELSEYCRSRGLYAENIQQWRNAAVAGQSKDILNKREREEFNQLKKKNKELEKELRRKEKALAEAAALLVLRKKAHAIWGEGEDD